MKRKLLISVISASLAAVLILSGCREQVGTKASTFGNMTNGVMVYSDGCVQDILMEEFDTTRYDAEELKGFLQEELDEFNAGHDFTPVPETNEEGTVVKEARASAPVSVARCDAKNNVLNMQLLYADTSLYLDYNEESVAERGGNTLQTGSLLYADTSVTGASYTDTEGDAIDMQELLTGKAAASYRYVICNFSCALYVEGEIKGYTSAGTYNSAAEFVSVPAGETVIVLYK